MLSTSRQGLIKTATVSPWWIVNHTQVILRFFRAVEHFCMNYTHAHSNTVKNPKHNCFTFWFQLPITWPIDSISYPYVHPPSLPRGLVLLYPSSPRQKTTHMQHVINSLAQSIHCFSPMKGALVHPSWRSQMSCSLVPSSTLKSRCDRMTLQDSCPVAQNHRKESNINEYSNESVWRIQKEIYVVYYPIHPFSSSCCVVVDCNKTLGEDAKERLCSNESQWEWISILMTYCRLIKWGLSFKFWFD